MGPLLPAFEATTWQVRAGGTPNVFSQREVKTAPAPRLELATDCAAGPRMASPAGRSASDLGRHRHRRIAATRRAGPAFASATRSTTTVPGTSGFHFVRTSLHAALGRRVTSVRAAFDRSVPPGATALPFLAQITALIQSRVWITLVAPAAFGTAKLARSFLI